MSVISSLKFTFNLRFDVHGFNANILTRESPLKLIFNLRFDVHIFSTNTLTRGANSWHKYFNLLFNVHIFSANILIRDVLNLYIIVDENTINMTNWRNWNEKLFFLRIHVYHQFNSNVPSIYVLMSLFSAQVFRP